MKMFLKILLVVICGQGAMAQEISGEAIYVLKKKIDLDQNISEEEKTKKEERLKKLYEKKMQLKFNTKASFYKEMPTLLAEENAMYRLGFIGGSGGYISNGIYKNIEADSLVEQREFLGKLFLVKDNVPELDWELKEKAKKIGNYDAFMATAVVQLEIDNSANPLKKIEANYIMTAWYTPQIPVAHGPDVFYGLPGLILEVHLKDTVLLCEKVTLELGNNVSIDIPTTGEVVTLAKYNQIVVQKLKEREN
ncbi:GLPGLI family protein [Rasiella rasia]|uniref:GLPGLI family protein n=1 Tax=Rasiella rasia TaxID=2744027 RepID=A0A6G6GNT9_9FLAO|nr:GLPGLI family protein [Rasiella rasia]QIE60246.1 GLPGLI family protein [Rasiella rasia]